MDVSVQNLESTQTKQIDKKFVSRDEIKGLFKKEAEELSNRVSLNEKKHLVLKLSEREIRHSLIYDADEHKYVNQFTMEFYSFIDSFRKYKVSQADTFELEIDEAVNPELKATFLQTWKQHLADEIVRSNDDLKALKRKMVYYSIFGFLIIALIIASYITYYFLSKDSEKLHNAALILTILLGNGIYVFGWGMVWDVFTNLFGEYSLMKRRLVNLFLMYKI